MATNKNKMSMSPIEKNKLENIDLLQIEYLTDLPLSAKDVVVIEPNNAISMTIRKFLANLGFENIHVCTEINEGMKIFIQFIGIDTNVPIIIDSDGYKNVKNTIEEILEIQPSASVIIITTKEKKETQIIELIDVGISSIVQKPLIFEEFKKSFSYIVEGNTDAETKSTKNLESSLLLSKKISQNKIKDILKKETSEIQLLIKNMIDDKKIVSDTEILEASCNQCNSTNITYISECPKCSGTNFQQTGLIEHYDCGEVYPKEADYNTCPKCNKQIGTVGAGYREFSEFYVCSSCDDRFPKPAFKFVCLDCNNIFIESLASWNKSKTYRVQN